MINLYSAKHAATAKTLVNLESTVVNVCATLVNGTYHSRKTTTYGGKKSDPHPEMGERE